MKHSTITTFIFSCLAAALCLVFASQHARAQGEIVSVDRPTVQGQKTPKYTVSGPRDKKYTQKTWIEIEVPFTALKAPKGATSLDRLTFNYYVLFEGKTKSLLTATLTHPNVPIKEKTASVVYISPQAIQKLTGSSSVASPEKMVKAYGVDVQYDGKSVGFFDSTGAKSPDKGFWTAEGVQSQDGYLLPKKDTPFAPLWYDYHAEVEG